MGARLPCRSFAQHVFTDSLTRASRFIVSQLSHETPESLTRGK